MVQNNRQFNFNHFQKLIHWSKESFNLPWRNSPRDIYKTWVSEVMLQQTTVSTVTARFTPFIERFPTLEHIVSSNEDDLLFYWQGLGYYRRARNLYKGAKKVFTEMNKIIPSNYKELLSVDGIGEYTARALLSIGFDKPYFAVDANLERVFARYLGMKGLNKDAIKENILKEEVREGSFLKLLLEKFSPRLLNEALMDLGREVCVLKGDVRCEKCPLKESCSSYRHNEVKNIPLQTPREKKIEITLVRFLVKGKVAKEKSLYLYQKSSKEWLSKQYEFPTFFIEGKNLENKEIKWNQYQNIPSYLQDEIDFLKPFKILKSTITKYQITNLVFKISHKNINKIKKILPIEELSWDGEVLKKPQKRVQKRGERKVPSEEKVKNSLITPSSVTLKILKEL